MKNLFVLFLLFFTTDSHSSGIASNTNSAPCTNNTLETYSGNSNLSADWQPNEIKLRWYNGNTLMDVQESANTCVYDGTLTIPQTAPTRTGYTFDGWTVRPEIDFSTIPTDTNGRGFWAKGRDDDADHCEFDTTSGRTKIVDCNSDANYGELQIYEWKVRFEHGDVYGVSKCSSTGGTNGQPGKPAAGTGQYCWCKATGYKTTNSNVMNRSLYNLSWVYYYPRDVCTRDCVVMCAHVVNYYSTWRAVLFNSRQ